MKIGILSFCLAFIVYFGAISASAQCVKCELAAAQKQSIWECVPATQGGQSCATSSGQQDCIMHGTCTSFGLLEDGCVTSEKVKSITFDASLIDAVFVQSDVFGRALSLINERDALGAEKLRIFTTERGLVVEISVGVTYQGGRPTVARLARLDNSSVLEMYIQKGVDLIDPSIEVWEVGTWVIK